MKGAGADDPFPLPQTGLDFRYIIQRLTRPDGPRLKCGLRFSDKDHVASVHLLNGRSGYDKGSSAEMSRQLNRSEHVELQTHVRIRHLTANSRGSGLGIED